jgi:choline dehydrogenase-like flavoprotein
MEVNSIMVAKALGGCGIHNAMLYVRAIEADLIRWNLSSWTWEDTLATYLKLEHWVGEPVAYHGLGGPITTRYVSCDASNLNIQ